MAPLLALLILLQDPDAKAGALIGDLRTDDAIARRAAVEGLLDLGKACVPAILRTLADETPGLAARVEELVGKLNEKDWKTRDEAMRALSRIGRRAIDFLKPHAENANAEVRWRVKTALAEIEELRPRESALDFARNAALCQVLGLVADPQAVKPLSKQLLESGSADVRLRAGEALGLLRSAMTDADADEACEELIKLLGASKDRRERSLIVKTMGLLRSASAVKPLSSLVESKAERDVHLKRNAMAALAAISDAGGLAAVVRALESEDVYLRDAASCVLAPLIGETGFDPRLEVKANADAVKKAKAWWAKKFGKSWEE
jgi:HEAT repeat protein